MNQGRILEIGFYFTCSNLLTVMDKKLPRLHEFFQQISFTNAFDYDILIDVTTDMFINRANVPSIIECALIIDYYPNKLTKQDIKKFFKISTNTLTRYTTETRLKKLNITTVLPKYPKEVHEAIKGFCDTLHTFSKWSKYYNGT